MFQLHTRPTLALRLQDHKPFQDLTYLETNQEVTGDNSCGSANSARNNCTKLRDILVMRWSPPSTAFNWKHCFQVYSSTYLNIFVLVSYFSFLNIDLWFHQFHGWKIHLRTSTLKIFLCFVRKILRLHFKCPFYGFCSFCFVLFYGFSEKHLMIANC